VRITLREKGSIQNALIKSGLKSPSVRIGRAILRDVKSRMIIKVNALRDVKKEKKHVRMTITVSDICIRVSVAHLR
jgi:hypothetical protein